MRSLSFVLRFVIFSLEILMWVLADLQALIICSSIVLVCGMILDRSVASSSG